MAIFAERAERRRCGLCGNSRTVISWLVLTLLVCLPGCRGCSKTPDQIEKEKQEAEEKAKKKKKEEEIKPFEAGQPKAMPTNSLTGAICTCKPGHWLSQTWPDVKANLGDFQGELQTEVVDAENHKVPLVAVPYDITNERPAALAKQQQKSLDSMIWVPTRETWKQPGEVHHNAHRVDIKLQTPGGGAVALESSIGLTAMPSYQYFFVVLTKGSRFDYLDKRLNSIRLHRSRTEGDNGPKFYEVVTLPANRKPALPASALCWTSIAYLLWDESDPALWDLDQQQALIDWLHWGGQIIVSGPDALVQLQTSFLRPYLPATVEKTTTFTDEDLDELQTWAGANGFAPKPKRPWPGAKLKTDPQARYIDYTGNTVIERRVGRGRIVASAFRIAGSEFVDWKGCDCFFNACLLRRSPREFSTDLSGDLRVKRAGVKNAEKSKEASADASKSIEDHCLADARIATHVRYFARDEGVKFKTYAADVWSALHESRNEYDNSAGPSYMNGLPIPEPVSSEGGGDEFAPPPQEKDGAAGIGAWNDFSPAAQAARDTLEDATGITIPERSFIIWVVVGYLCVLVPANWLVFRLMGRVEWAWIAAPLIAIACTVVVVRQAQLNIGFARSRNEVAVIEMQPGYSRAHVTRYTALYTSLATRYDFQLSDPGAEILPFSHEDGPENFRKSFLQSSRDVVCRRGEDTQLTGFDVSSNGKDSVHSEEMADFGGIVTLHQDSDGSLRVTNGTKHPLDNCRVVEIDEKSGDGMLASIDRLDPGAIARLTFTTFDRRAALAANERPAAAEPSGELSVERIEKVAIAQRDMRPGEVCLVAQVADDVPGLTVTPAARQSRQAALLVAHLKSGEFPPPEADANSPATAFSPSGSDDGK